MNQRHYTGSGVVFLDFDGVLFDTATEAYVVAKMVQGGECLFEDIDRFSEDCILFRKYRYLVTEAWTCGCLLELISQRHKYDESEYEQRYEDIKRSCEHKMLREYERRYFEKRSALREIHMERWLQLQKPYHFFNELKDVFNSQRKDVYIITTKDKDSVEALLEGNSVSMWRENILDRNSFRKHGGKGSLIEEIMKQHGYEYSFYLDDSIEHIQSCEGIEGIEACVADWGYTNTNMNLIGQDEALKKIHSVLGEKICSV